MKKLLFLSLLFFTTALLFSQTQLELLEKEISFKLEESYKINSTYEKFYRLDVFDVWTDENSFLYVTGSYNTTSADEEHKETFYDTYQFRAKGKMIMDSYRIYIIQYKISGERFGKEDTWLCVYNPSGKCDWK